ncbi:diaminopimelate decarboxylase [Enterorhabdus sp. P55]|uniref:diaminopimelate decarboxylase n=1 Tax=Enterorhabdus sp. P55 TaxID=2304571 RepID=UPI001368A7A2|nr:diaminopimelate decarboxylase [Enterorhabdus sp. P55]MCI8452344.1 diaminopimelate decarboxylase [Eggerthellaceae bacterium]NBI31672.1 diaminopimelate decarboxylase [Enterorhabdus sp. P55]
MSLPASDLTKQPDLRTTMELGAVLPATAEVRDDHLFIGGVDMVELAREQGTALYVFDEADLVARMEAYREAFRARYENSDIIYASKAFLNKEVLRLAQREGLCLDVSGGGELACAQSVGFPMERVFVHGNNKTPQELEEAISAGVGRIILDSRIELARVSEIAGRLGKTQDIYMRITPGVEADTHEYIRTGCEDSKFGFTMLEDFAYKCVADVLAAPNVRLAGLHCHIGSQIFALHSFREAAQVMVEFMARIREGYGYLIEELDLGGGLGIAYTAEDKPSSIDDFAEVTCAAVREFCADHDLPLPRLLVEPGRSLVANAGVTLYTVGILKTLPGIRKYVAVDGGMSDNIRTALYHADYEPVIANKAGQPRTEIVTLCGKHCESGDAVVIDMPLQHPDLGDVVCVFGTGAYNMTMASNYNGQPRPAVVFVRDGQARVVTRRETYNDLYARDL